MYFGFRNMPSIFQAFSAWGVSIPNHHFFSTTSLSSTLCRPMFPQLFHSTKSFSSCKISVELCKKLQILGGIRLSPKPFELTAGSPEPWLGYTDIDQRITVVFALGCINKPPPRLLAPMCVLAPNLSLFSCKPFASAIIIVAPGYIYKLNCHFHF